LYLALFHIRMNRLEERYGEWRMCLPMHLSICTTVLLLVLEIADCMVLSNNLTQDAYLIRYIILVS